MIPLPVLAGLCLLCGLAVGLAVNRILRSRLPHPGAPSAGGQDRAGLGRIWPGCAGSYRGGAGLWLHPVVLGAISLGLPFHPGLAKIPALSQALLLLYLLYPLALVDLLTLTVEPLLVIGGLTLRLTAVLTVFRPSALEMVGGMLAGAGLLYLIGFGYRTLRAREGLGEGDAAVMGLIGAFVGWQGILPVVLLATAGGLLAGFPLLLVLRKPLHTPLPFVPFLCLAGWVVYLGQAGGWLPAFALPPLGY